MKAQHDGFAMNDSFYQTAIHARRLHFGSVHARFVDIELRPIKATAIVYGGHHVFDGVIRFQKRSDSSPRHKLALWPFAKAKLAKLSTSNQTFSPTLLNSPSFGSCPKTALHAMKLVALLEFPTHATPQNICIGQVEIGKIVGHTNHVFLIDHHSIGFR